MPDSDTASDSELSPWAEGGSETREPSALTKLGSTERVVDGVGARGRGA